MSRKPKSTHIVPVLGGLLLSTLPALVVSAESLDPKNVTSITPSRCYWLERGLPDEGLCGKKLKPNMPVITAEAEAGNAFAAFRLGQLHSSGAWGVVMDEGKARFWYERAANGGVRSAQVQMGRAYELGRLGLERDLPKSVRYYEMVVSEGLYPDLEERLLKIRRLMAE